MKKIGLLLCALAVVLAAFLVVSACGGKRSGGPISHPPGGGGTGQNTGPGSVAGTVADISGTPVQGVAVSVRGTSLASTSDSLGSFLIENAPSGQRTLFVDGSTAPGGKYTSFTQDVYVVGGDRVSVDFTRSLIKIDAASETPVGPSGGTIVNPGIPGLSVSIPFGTLMDSGTGSITALPFGNLPFELPNGYLPLFAYWLEPANSSPSHPITLTLDNTFGLAPGQRIRLFSARLDDTGYAETGWMEVSANGSVIATVEGGIGFLPYVVGGVLPHLVEGYVRTFADNAFIAGITVSTTGGFLSSSVSSAITDQNGRYKLSLVGTVADSPLSFTLERAGFVVSTNYRTTDPFDLTDWGPEVLVTASGSPDTITSQLQDFYVDRVFVSADTVAVGAAERDKVEIRTNETDRDASSLYVREVSQINLPDLLSRDSEVNLFRSDQLSPVTAGMAVLSMDHVATGKQSRAKFALAGNQGFVSVDSKSELEFSSLEEISQPHKRIIFGSTSNGRFYVSFSPTIDGQTTDSKITITTPNAQIEATDADFTLTATYNATGVTALIEVWRGSVTFTNKFGQKEVKTVKAGESATYTASADQLAPNAPDHFTAVKGLRYVTLRWDSPTQPNVTGFNLYRRAVGDTQYTKITPNPLVPAGGVTETYVDFEIPVGGVEYSYQVTAANPIGTESQPSTATATPDPISPTSGSNQSLRAVIITWNDTPADSHLTGYNVYRATSDTGPFVKQNQTAIVPTIDRLNNTYTDANFDFSGAGADPLGQVYYYYVKVLRTGGWEGAQSKTVLASPTAINVSANQSPLIRQVTITWQDTFGNGNPDLLGYNVYRKGAIDPGYSGTLNATLIPKSAGVITFNDFDFPALTQDAQGNPTTPYFYTVKRVMAGGVQLTPSNEVTVSPRPIQISTVDLDRAERVLWTDTAKDPGTVGYHVWRSRGAQGQIVFPNDFTRLNQVLVPVQPDVNNDYVENYVYLDSSVKNFTYVYVVTPVYQVLGNYSDLAPSPEAEGTPVFSLVQNFYATGLEFITPNVGFIWGRKGLVIKTIDGGDSFEKLQVFSASELSALHPTEIACADGDFVNGNIGFLLYNHLDGTSFIKHTNSGGGLWDTIIPQPAGLQLSELTFVNSATGFATGPTTAEFLVSANGGGTWGLFAPAAYAADGYPATPKSIAFSDASNGVAFDGGYGTIVKPPLLWLYSGGTWRISTATKFADTNDDNIPDTAVPLKVKCLSGLSYAFSYTGDQLLGYNSFFTSTAGGFLETGFSIDFFPSDVEFTSSTTGWAIGNGFKNGYILKTTSGGNLWDAQLTSPTPFEREYSHLFAADSSNVFAVSAGSFYRTSDSGVNWQELPIQIYN